MIVVEMMDPWHMVLVLTYIRREPVVVLRRLLRRHWRVDDPLPVLAEAKRRVGVALAGSARPRSQVPRYVTLPAHV